MCIFLRRRAALLLLPLVLGLSNTTQARSYAFEMIIFERPGAPRELNLNTSTPPNRSLATAALETGALPASSKSLGPVAYTLKRNGMVVHKHIAWRQVPGKRNSRTWRWVSAGRLSGLVRVTRGRYLHLDADLSLADGAAAPQRIQVSRRFRSDELHYVDHPKIGILIRARRLQARAPDAKRTDPASGEPKPADPGG